MIVDVVVPYRVNQSFHYKLDQTIAPNIGEGSVVEVSLGSKKTHTFDIVTGKQIGRAHV